MTNNRGRRPSRDEQEPSLSEQIGRLGKYGEELREALEWCHERGMSGLAEFYQDEIWYRVERLGRRRRPEQEEAR